MYGVHFVTYTGVRKSARGGVRTRLTLTPLANLTFASEIIVGDITDKWNATRDC